ncbi:MAG: phosphonate C-P lyase system protein PhnH [Pseudomonadota bacterium]
MTVTAGFADPARDAQATFRCLLEAIAHPGRIVDTVTSPSPPAPLLAPAYALVLSLLDYETPVWLDNRLATAAVRDTLRLHCGCPIVTQPQQASFALLAAGTSASLDDFAAGTPEYPDRSATLVWQVEDLSNDGGAVLSGPGILGSTRLNASGLPADFWTQWGMNHRQYPLGVDVVLVTADGIAALPRSIEVQA